MWISGFEELRIRGIRGAEGLEEFFASLHYFITKKKFKSQSSSEVLSL
jgi:hypothetical protein